MKILTSIIVAAALVAPAAATAGGRVNTPGTDARHEANLAEEKAEPARESQARAIEEPSASASNTRAGNEPKKRQYRSALAGKRNVAKRVRD